MTALATKWTSQFFATLGDNRLAAGDLACASTLVVVGSRSDAGTFPYGFFQAWRLNSNTGRSERFARQ